MALIHQRHLVRLEREVDVFIARELAATLAATGGFDGYQSSNIETAISELSTNALKYGERGWACLRIDSRGFEAVVTDEGPGFGAAPESRSGLRVGLAGVKRLMDAFETESLPGGGRVTIRKDLPRLASRNTSKWAVDVVTRIRAGKSVSGDRFWVRDTGRTLLVAVIDGLGTGQGAAEASLRVIESLDSTDASLALDEMLSVAHHNMETTRGAVCLLMRADAVGHSVECAGLGDVGGFIEPPAEHLPLTPGILGVDRPDVRVSHYPWTDQSRLTVWTDGIRLSSEEISWSDEGTPPGDWAEAMALEHGMDRDDGMILTLRQTGTQ